MWNQLTTRWHDQPSRQDAWDSDRAPGLRLGLLWGGMVLPLLFVAFRMAQLQTALRDDYIKGFQQTYETIEIIPARDGRILTSDGRVLAGESERIDLQVHYRLVQSPLDPKWLRNEALTRLNRVERRNKILVEQEESKVLARRDTLWSALAELTGIDEDELSRSRESVQRRVEKIKETVLAARKNRDSQSEEKRRISLLKSSSSWGDFWNRMQIILEEPSHRRDESGPIAEEESHHVILQDVGAEVRSEIDAHPERYPGVRVVVATRRTYPEGELASHLIGVRTPVTPDEMKKERAPNSDRVSESVELVAGDRVGRSGLELQYDEHLRGVPGIRSVVKNRRGESVESRVVREPRHGHDLVITLDAVNQQVAEKLLDDALQTVTLPGTSDAESSTGRAVEATCPQGGSLVAIDVHTGAILAMASAPRFDVNLLVRADENKWKEVIADPRKPLFPRATLMALAPGSVFKIVTAVAGLESGRIQSDSLFECRGYLDRPDQHRCLTYRHFKVGHGPIDLDEALSRSCNVYFFTAARRMGPKPLVDWATRFGFGQVTNLDLPSESPGWLPSPEKRLSGQQSRWSVGDTLGLSIGQSELLATPLQIARLLAAIANDGMLVTPHLAADAGPAVITRDDAYVPRFAHPEPTPIDGLNEETLKSIRAGLFKVVNDPHGTGYKTVHLKEIEVAGKTGTAETNGTDHAWFAGYVPAHQPQVALVVVLEHGGSGGKAAGPVARRFVKHLLDTGVVSPTREVARE